MNTDMAGQGQEQPDFQAIEEIMNRVGRLPLELATNLGRVRNVPALDSSAMILAELRAMREEMREMRQDMKNMEQRITTRLEAA